MTQMTKELLQEIVRHAVLNETFREELKSVITSSKKEISIELSELDIEDLKVILPDIDRFGSVQGLHSDDAKNWTIGLFQITDRRFRPRHRPPTSR